MMSTATKVKRQMPPESVYAQEVRQGISDSQLADLQQAQAEDFARDAELRRVVEPGDYGEAS
jgi:hypothetical protein